MPPRIGECTYAAARLLPAHVRPARMAALLGDSLAGAIGRRPTGLGSGRQWSEGRRAMPEQVRTILLYAQDRKGLGHINRTLTIARHLLAADAAAIALIVTKSPVPAIFSVPERCDFIKLP